MTRVKICGVREPEHALVAAEAGADLIGMVYAVARRQITREQGREIVATLRRNGYSTPVVGVFLDQPLEFIDDIVDTCRLDYVQLCGREDWDYCEKVRCKVLRVVPVPADAPPDSLLPQLRKELGNVVKHGHFPLLDTASPDFRGGTGKQFDWRIARSLAHEFDFLLAGGLTPENVWEAITKVHPWGVDVSSGVETDGVKDSDKIRTFVRSARLAVPPARQAKEGSRPV